MNPHLPFSFATLAVLAPFALAEPQPDFTLPDVNPGSIRAGQLISPRDYDEQIPSCCGNFSFRSGQRRFLAGFSG